MTRFDLHIHTALSACAEDIMSPRQIIMRARDAGLGIIAITDHNASANVATAISLGMEFGVKVIPAVEISTLEEVHILAFFKSLELLQDFQEMIDRSLPPGENIPDVSGNQLIYDCSDEIVDMDERIRNIGLSIHIEHVMNEIIWRGGFSVPAHVYKKRYSLISQLGFIDKDTGYDALEIQSPMWIHDNYRLGQKVEGYPVISGSDSHFLESVGRFFMEIPETTDNLNDLFKIIKEKV